MPRWSRFDLAADRKLVKGLHDGDPDALGTLYDRYSERLYDYCKALLQDERAVADIVHDVFIDASRRAPRLRERERLRPWLYAAVRRRCLRRERPHDLWANPGTDFAGQEATYLALRHDLRGDDLAAVLGVPVRRLKPVEAPDLTEAPGPVLPATLRHRVLHTGTDPELAGYRAEIAARGGPLTVDGLPRQPDAPSPLARRWTFAAGGTVAALAGAAVALMLIGPGQIMTWPYEPHPSSVGPPKRHSTVNPRSSHGSEPGDDRRQGQPALPQFMASPPPAAPGQGPGHPPSGTPSPQPGRLVVSPMSIRFTGYAKQADLTFTAQGGPVSWAATSGCPQITLSSTNGRLTAGHRVTIKVYLDRALVTLPGQSTIAVTGDRGPQTPVAVSWNLSLL